MEEVMVKSPKFALATAMVMAATAAPAIVAGLLPATPALGQPKTSVGVSGTAGPHGSSVSVGVNHQATPKTNIGGQGTSGPNGREGSASVNYQATPKTNIGVQGTSGPQGNSGGVTFEHKF
jgi:hypothetical protein